MRQPILIGIILALSGVGLAASSWSRGQMPISTGANESTGTIPAKQRDLTKCTVQQRNFYLSGQRGMDWLQRANRPDGRFVHGFIPALRLPMEGDSYVRQAGAAFALARSAKFYGDNRAAAIAKQALLTLLLETSFDPARQVRTIPIHQANPLIFAGTLLAAIHELPVPADDLLDQGDQLASLLQRHIREDGSLSVAITGEDAVTDQTETVQHYTGPALYGVIRSQALRPAAWKLEALLKARPYYYSYWKQHKNVPMLAWHSAAYTEAYLVSRDPGFAETVFEMNDWLCGLQYQQSLPPRAAWVGGFQPWTDGKAVPLAPDIGSAGAVASLAEACRLARAAGDVQHYERYRQALENGLQFLATLQYTDANTQHFADWYRPALVGGFHASHQDGNLRLDYSQHTLSALVQYLRHVADVP